MVDFVKLIDGLRRIAKARKRWSASPRVDIAIFDSQCGAHLARMLEGYQFALIDIRGESYHIPTVISACWRYVLCNGRVRISVLYFSMLIQNLASKICITNQDANQIFFDLDKQLPGVRFVAVQQGLKDEYSIGGFSRISGDYFAFGQAYANRLANGIASMYVCGSIKANMAHLRKEKITRVCYISGFIGCDLDMNVFRDVNYAEFAYPAIYTSLREIDRFCRSREIELIIVSKANREVTTLERNQVFEKERDLYTKVLGRKPPLIAADSYELAGESELIVCDQSALGYELIGQNCKVVFINLVAHYHREKSYRFGWPLELPERGPFWTNEYDAGYIHEMLATIWNMPAEEWNGVVAPYREQLMHFDPDNAILLNHIDGILGSALRDV